jgi:hypothetical protein
MFRVFLILLAFGFLIIVDADSAIQTDWSGGPGMLGPVLDWSNLFYLAADLEWGAFPGHVVLQLDSEHSVDEDFSEAWSVYSQDIDGDGDMDILGAADGDDDITWWENLDGSGIHWTEHIIDDYFQSAKSVYSEDIDNDGDMDVLGAAYHADDITWWENVDGLGTAWNEHTVDGNFDGARSVYAEDIDDDGDMDILGAASLDDNNIIWWENADGSGTSWVEHIIDDKYSGATSVYSEDIDGDGDMDVIGATSTPIDIHVAWWENSDTGSGIYWTRHIIMEEPYTLICMQSVYSGDIDGDGDMDVVGASSGDRKIRWWENEDGTGLYWTDHIIDHNFRAASSVYSEDMDNDGDMDVLGAASYDDDITWWENLDGLGTSWNEHTVDGNFEGARSVYAEDIDGDGNMDVLGAARYDEDITWWDITAEYPPDGSLESSILDVQVDPYWDYLEWNSQISPETSISFQVRASDDHTAMGAWSDTLQTPGPLNGILSDGDRYVQYRMILETSDPDASPTLFDVTLTWDQTGIEESETPTVAVLLPFSPNPSTFPAVRFGLPEPAFVDLTVFDLSGRLVSEIHGDEYSPGYHSVLLNGLTPGIYFCRMITGDFIATERFVVIE